MATTIAAIDMISKALEQKIRAIKANNEEEQNQKIEETRTSILSLFSRLRDIDPLLFPFELSSDKNFSETQYPQWVKQVVMHSETNERLSLICTSTGCMNVIGRQAFGIPKYIDLGKKPHVLLEPYQDDAWGTFAMRMLNQLVLTCMMSLPRGQVRVNIINMQWSDKANMLTQNLPDNICRVCLDEKETSTILTELTERMKSFLKTGKIPSNLPSVELLVLLDYPKGYDLITDKMRIIVEKGSQAGIHLIVLNDLRLSFESMDDNESKPFDLLSLKEGLFQQFGAFKNRPKDSWDIVLSRTFAWEELAWLQESFFNYLKGIPVPIVENEKQGDSKEEINMSCTVSDLSVIVGKKEDGAPADFLLDTVSHVHAFVLGQSGSGKSVFLHSVLFGLIKKYSPSDLCLYLMDFKLGGVEFNRYRDIKHVRALLVDNSDIQITLEILRDLSNQMRERGKLLREAGVSNIKEYNQKNPNQHLPQILFVADECHELFNMQGRGSRMVKQEIQTIITKIAKEGRSQGVHLLLATQTLAGAEISNEILNNVTEHYLLKCAIEDSEKMVRGSSRITANQQVGQVFYHHTEVQYQFQSTYLPKEELGKTIQNIVSQTTDLPSNGQFYFSGAQAFNMLPSEIDSVSKNNGNSPVAVLGHDISLKQTPLAIALKRDFSENILLFGIDENHQVTRTTMAAIISLLISYKQKEINAQMKVIDCGNDEDADYLNILDILENKGICHVLARRERATELKKLAESIADENVVPTILIVIGQERFRELKLNLEIKDAEVENAQTGDADGMVNVFAGLNFTSSLPGEKKQIDVSNFEKAMRYILENGPEQGVHTILQIDKPSKLLFQEFVSSKNVFSMFKHIVMLRSEEKTAMTLGLSDDIRLEDLSSEQERLRAYYYSEEDDSYQLFSPYMLPTENELNNILNQL